LNANHELRAADRLGFLKMHALGIVLYCAFPLLIINDDQDMNVHNKKTQTQEENP